MCGGWLPPGADLTAGVEVLGGLGEQVRALVTQVRREAESSPAELDETALRGVARIAALVDAVRAPGVDSAPLFADFMGHALDEPVEAFVEPATRDLALQCFAVCASVSGAVKRGQSTRKLLQDRAKAEQKRRTREAVAARPDATVAGLPGIIGPYVVPRGWNVSDDGLYRLLRTTSDGEKWERIAPSPILLIGSSADASTGERFVELFWRDPTHGRSTRHPVPRADIATPAGLLALAAYGAPVNCENVRKVSAFLMELEAVNAEVLPARTVVQSMGWVPTTLGTDARTFVLGESAIGAEDVTCMPLVGSEQHLKGWSAAGSYDAWEAAVRPVVEGYPVPAVMYLASLAAPLVALLGRDSFVVEIACETGHGKTTALRLAASVWGNPAPGCGVVHSWDATRDALLKLAGFTANLPYCLDDTKTAGHSRGGDLGDMPYLLTHGQGSLKARPGGLRRAGRWALVTLSTGEAPLVERSNNAGARARVLTLTRLPFGPQSEVGRTLTTGIDEAMRLDHGHAGRRFVEHLTSADLDDLRTRLGECRAWLAGRFEPGTATRLSDHAALLLLAADIAHGLGLPAPDFDAVADVLSEAVRDGAESADRPRAALVALLSWVESRPARVFNRKRNDAVPGLGWIANRRELDFAIVKDDAERFLDGRGYDVPGCLRSWAGRAWLRRPTGKGYTKAVRFGAEGRPRCLCIPWDVVNELLGEDDGEEES
jgi:hypothetical protein